MTMTREQITAKKAELYAIAKEQVAIYNNALQAAKYDVAEKANEAILKAIDDYTSIATAECLAQCAAADNPMIEAVKRLTFQTIGARDVKKGEEGDIKISVREIVEKEKTIDLVKLHKKVTGGIGHNKQWIYIAEKMNFLLTAQRAIDLGVDLKHISNSYAMNSISQQIDMGKSPTSKTNLLKTLQTVVTAMIGEEYKATSHDVNYLLAIYSRKTRKALTVQCANHRYFRNYLMEICHRIILGKTYNVEYKKRK